MNKKQNYFYLLFVHQYLEGPHYDRRIEQQVNIYEVISVLYEDQSNIQNGKWLHIIDKNYEEFSISIDDMDFYEISMDTNFRCK